MARLSSFDLNQAFVAALGAYVQHVDDLHAQVLSLALAPPLPPQARAYLFNATNPPGGRATLEHKIQLMVPGQGRRDRGNFDFSGGRAVVVAGKAVDKDAWIFWDASLHRDFAFSKNAQVRTATIDTALATGAIATQERRLPMVGTETVIAAPSARVVDALLARFPPVSGGPPPVPTVTVPPVTPASPSSHGRAYIAPPRGVGGPDEPKTRVFEVDPNLVDRGTLAHKDTQDALAEVLESQGLIPLSPAPTDPQFDIAWLQDGVAYVTEVKSLTDANEERQLRLGLGQVLSYVHLLDWPHATAVRAVLAVERRPTADYWTTLCAEHDVVLTWPEAYGDLFVDEP